LERTVVSRGSRAPVPVRPPPRGEVEPGTSALLPLEGLALVALASLRLKIAPSTVVPMESTADIVLSLACDACFSLACWARRS